MKKLLLSLGASILMLFSANSQITVYPYLEDFEAGAGGWTAIAGGTWALGAPTGTVINSAASGTNAWVTNLAGNYNNNETGSVESPIFDFTLVANPSLTFSFWYNSENSWDGTVIQSSIDGGISWQNIGALGDPNWFNDGTINGNPGGQQIGWTGGPGSGGWISATQFLTGLGGQASVILRIAFGSDGSVTSYDGFGFDDINVYNVTCPQPTNLGATNILATSVDLNWNAVANAVDYTVEWGTPGFAPGTGAQTGTATNIAGLTTPATGLTPITTYEFYVMTDCGATDGTSNWAGPFSFLTACATFTAPWIDDVEAHPANVNLTNSMCWDATSTSFYDWNITGTGTTPSGGTGPNVANSGTNYFYIEASSGVIGDEATLTSPNIDVTALAVPMIRFYYHMTGAQIGTLNVEAWDGTVWNTVDVITGQQQAAQADPWLMRDVSLPGYTGVIQVRFRAVSAGTIAGDISIDDISIFETPTCQQPTNLSVTSITDVSANLNWDAIGNAVDYSVEWGVPGFTPGTGTEVGSATGVVGLTTTATGLTPITTYEFYVMTNCGAIDGVSFWAGPFSFTTACATSTSPWTDDVEAHLANVNLTSSLCWDATSTTAYDWNITGTGTTPSGGTGPNVANSGTNYFYTEASSGTTGDEATLTSPNIDVTALTLPMIRFYYHMTGAQIGTLNVEAWDGTVWNTVDVITGQQQGTQADPWLMRDITLPGYTGVIQIRFRAVSAGTFAGDISIDDVSIFEAPTCPQPSNFIVTASDLTSGTFSWTNGGGESEWALEYGPVGFTPGTGTSVLTATNPSTITGLTSNQFYDVYVRAICTPGDTSFYTGAVSFNTYDQPTYMDWNTACPTAGFIDISGTGTDMLLTDDSEAGITPLPFPVLFQGLLMNSITIGDNGGAVLGTSTGNVGFGGNLNTLANGTMLPWGDDLFPGDGAAYTEVTGTAPNQVFIAQWDTYSNCCNNTSDITFQIQIHEATGEIFYVYDDVVFGNNNVSDDYGNNADIGISGPNQDYTVSTNDPTYLENNSCVRFFYTDCPSPKNLSLTYATTDEFGLSWTAGISGETNWTVIYGPTGFDPLTSGTTVTTTVTAIIIPGLSQLTTYDIYIYADCNPGIIQSEGFMGTYTTLPNCSDVTGLGGLTAIDSLFTAWNWTESSGVGTYPSTGFNVQYGLSGFPIGSGAVVNADNNFTDTTFDATLGSATIYDIYVQAVCGSDTSGWVGPITVLTPLTNDEPCFADPLLVDGSIYTIDGSTATVAVGEDIISPPATGCMTTTGWCDTIISFSTWFTFVAPNTGMVEISGTDQGFNGQVAVYEVGDCTDFNTYTLIGANDDATDGSSLAPKFIVCGLVTGNTYYIMHDAASTFSSGTFSLSLDSLSGQSYAGGDNSLSACKNEPIDLNNSLTTGANLGGDWYDQFDVAVGGSFITTSNLSGFYNYTYITTSTSCPDDTANIVIDVSPACDYLGLLEVDADYIEIYPNPTASSIFIRNLISENQFNVTLYDLKGKVLYAESDVLIGSSDVEVNVENLEDGIYILRLSNQVTDRTYRIVKQ